MASKMRPSYAREAVDEARQRRVVSVEAKEGHDIRLVLFEWRKEAAFGG